MEQWKEVALCSCSPWGACVHYEVVYFITRIWLDHQSSELLSHYSALKASHECVATAIFLILCPTYWSSCFTIRKPLFNRSFVNLKWQSTALFSMLLSAFDNMLTTKTKSFVKSTTNTCLAFTHKYLEITAGQTDGQSLIANLMKPGFFKRY